MSTSSSSFAILGGVIARDDGWPTVDLVQFYNIGKNSWRTAAPLPLPLNHANGAAVGNKIYVLGGMTAGLNDTGSPFNWAPTSGSWVYDQGENSWAKIQSMPESEARGAAAVGVYKNVIYLAGGIISLLESVATVSAFDTVAGKWISLPAAAKALPAPRDHAGASVVGHTFYVLGGRDHGNNNTRDTVFALDLHDLAAGWITKKGKLPTARGGLAAATIGTKVYTFGGEGNPATESGVFNQTEVYDTEKDSWKKLGPMKLPRHGTSAVAIDGRVYIPGGGIVAGGGPVDTLDVFEPKHHHH